MHSFPVIAEAVSIAFFGAGEEGKALGLFEFDVVDGIHAVGAGGEGGAGLGNEGGLGRNKA